MKKIIVLILLTIVSLVGFGCSNATQIPTNSFSLTSKTSIYGEVTQTISVPTLVGEINAEEKQKKEYLTFLKNNIETKLYNNYYIRYWLRYLESEDSQFLIGGDYVKFNGPALSDDETEIYFNLIFLTQEAWQFYNSSNANSKSEESKSSDYFYFLKRSETEASFPFSDTSLKEYYYSVLNESYKKFFGKEVAKQTISFSYKYISPYSKLKSNADIKSQSEEGYEHVWIEGFNENDKTIKLSVVTINRGFWYLFVLVLTLFLLGIILIILKVLKRHKKS